MYIIKASTQLAASVSFDPYSAAHVFDAAPPAAVALILCLRRAAARDASSTAAHLRTACGCRSSAAAVARAWCHSSRWTMCASGRWAAMAAAVRRRSRRRLFAPPPPPLPTASPPPRLHCASRRRRAHRRIGGRARLAAATVGLCLARRRRRRGQRVGQRRPSGPHAHADGARGHAG